MAQLRHYTYHTNLLSLPAFRAAVHDFTSVWILWLLILAHGSGGKQHFSSSNFGNVIYEQTTGWHPNSEEPLELLTHIYTSTCISKCQPWVCCAAREHGNGGSVTTWRLHLIWWRISIYHANFYSKYDLCMHWKTENVRPLCMPLIGLIADHPLDLVKYSVRGLRDIVSQ